MKSKISKDPRLPLFSTFTVVRVYPLFKRGTRQSHKHHTVQTFTLLNFAQWRGGTFTLFDLLSASCRVITPSVFLPIKDESGNFWHVASKHSLHAMNTEKEKRKWHAARGPTASEARRASQNTYFLPLTALQEPPYFLRLPINSMISGTQLANMA